MEFIQKPLYTLRLILSVVLLVSLFVAAPSAASAAGERSNQPQDTPDLRAVSDPNRPSVNPDHAVSETDPNLPDVSETLTVSDPNRPSVNPESVIYETDLNLPADSEDDDFYPQLSTYLAINEAYSSIFTPELITDDGRVDYGTLRRKRQDVVRAAKELKELNPAILMALSRNEKIAFWINTYNFCTLKLIVDNYPIEPKLYMIFYPDNSIMQISGNWRTRHFFEIQGFEYTLEEIEWDFLLDRYKDPRIIFTLSYASYGGAMLSNEPYKAEIVDEQLDDQVRTFLQSPYGMRMNKADNVIELSNIFTMHNHESLFLASEYAAIKKFRNRPAAEQAWLNFIWHYLPPDDQRYLEEASPSIRFMKYDWLLNEAL